MPTNAALRAIADNPALFTAVKEVILAHFDKQQYGPELSNEQLGQITRAKIEGKQAVEDAFREIAQHVSTPAHPITELLKAR